MESTASTMAGVSFSARVALSFVDNDVRATEIKSSRSTSFSSLNESKNYRTCQHSNIVGALSLPLVSPFSQSRSHL